MTHKDVIDRWDTTVSARSAQPIQGWLDSPIVLESYVQPRIAGSPQVNWLIGLAARLEIPKAGRWLSLGCGSAGQEIFAAKSGLFGSMAAHDASPLSIDEGRKAAAAQAVANIEFYHSDLNELTLPVTCYDVVLMNMSLHHVKELRPLLSKVRRSLIPGGFFIINEYVGPRQCQFTDLQLSLVRELLQALPARWRKDSASGEVKSEYVRMPVEHWNIADPSEAIRSDRILPEIERQFETVERIDYGGTILNPMLEHIVHHFDPADEKDVAAIRLLCRVEDMLIRYGVLSCDFTAMASKPLPPIVRLFRSARSAIRDTVSELATRLTRFGVRRRPGR